MTTHARGDSFRFALGLAAALLLVPLSRPVSAREPLDVSLEELTGPRVTSGTKIRVTGKYRERFDDEILLYDSDIPFRIAADGLTQKLRELVPNRDNVVLVGVVRVMDDSRVVDVEEVAIGPADVERYRSALVTVPADAPDRSARLLAIARKIVETQKRWEDRDLLPLAQRAVRMSNEARLSASRPPTADEDLAFARAIEEILGDRDYLQETLIEAIGRHPQDARLATALRGLNCRPYQGTWVSYPEFKRREGFVAVDKAWLPPDELHLAETMKELAEGIETNVLLLRRRTDREYVLLAKSGRIETGMTPQEVKTAIGFPARVRRVPFVGREFAQWSYEDGYLYFLDETLVKMPAAHAPSRP